MYNVVTPIEHLLAPAAQSSPVSHKATLRLESLERSTGLSRPSVLVLLVRGKCARELRSSALCSHRQQTLVKQTVQRSVVSSLLRPGLWRRSYGDYSLKLHAKPLKLASILTVVQAGIEDVAGLS